MIPEDDLARSKKSVLPVRYGVETLYGTVRREPTKRYYPLMEDEQGPEMV
jgi:hypothetical protein